MRVPLPLVCVLSLVLALPAAAGPLEDGLSAYANGEWAEAWRLLQPLADEGNAQAQERIGRLYERGKNVPRDYRRALDWYLKAAAQGDAFAQGHAGFIYRSGAAGERDFATAAKWYREAARRNNPIAQVGLGNMYAAGEGVTEDPLEAAKWYRKAADQGDALGQLSLGLLCQFGRGVAKDAVEAYKWFILAAAGSDPEYDVDIFFEARRARDGIVDAMTPEQITEATARARAWKPVKL